MKHTGLILIAIMILTSPAYAWQSKAVKKANDFISAGMANEAIQTLESGIREEPKDSDAHWMLGKLYLERGNYSSAETRFNSAILLKPSLNSELGSLYKNVGSSMLAKGDIDQALTFYDKSIQQDPSLKSSINQSKSDYKNRLYTTATNQLKSNNINVAKQIHKQIIEIFPDEKENIFQSIIKIGNELNDQDCFNVYSYASILCDNKCPHNQEVGARLEEIANSFEKINFMDQRIEEYLQLASNFKNDVRMFQKIYQPGDEPLFNLSANEVTDHWMTTPYGKMVDSKFFSNNGKFEVHFLNGLVVKVWAGEAFPNDFPSSFRIKAIEDTKVQVKFIEKHI